MVKKIVKVIIIIVILAAIITVYYNFRSQKQRIEIVTLAEIELGEGTTPGEMIFVEGGELIPGIETPSFYIGKNLVTQEEFVELMGYNPSTHQQDGVPIHPYLPVEGISLSEAIEFCNRLSILSGYEPVYAYTDEQGEYGTDPGEWSQGWNDNSNIHIKLNKNIQFNREANGYRLPNRVEWEFAARGGVPAQQSGTFKDRYAGTDDVDRLTEYAWYSSYSKGRTRMVGTKLPNELGIYDMSGNVWELVLSFERRTLIDSRGGAVSWNHEYCTVTSSMGAKFSPSDRGKFHDGMRLCRNGY